MKQSRLVQEYALIILGTILVSFGVNWFLAPNGIVTGGISGIGIILQRVSGLLFKFAIPLWLTTIVLNIPLFLISIKQRGFGFAKKSAVAVMSLSIALAIVEHIPNPFFVGDDLLVSCIFGGALSGLGIGFVLRSSASTGGTDMLASIIRYKHPRFPIAKLMLGIDGLILLTGLFVFGADKAMYAIIAVFVSTRIVNNVLAGLHYAKAVFIISSESEAIAKAIMEKIVRGVTGLSAKGMYTKDTREMLFVVVSQKQITALRTLIQEIDPSAFVTIADVREVLGQGFIEDYNAVM
nr:YitT family protein [uncultured Niameybacter sp.]